MDKTAKFLAEPEKTGDIREDAGRDMLELSFPALKGASGSAVVELKGNQIIVHGIVVANTEHHLLPAQIETVMDESNDDVLEERKYFLPQGAAVNAVHMLGIVNQLTATATAIKGS